MGRSLAVCCGAGPLIVPSDVFPNTLVDHGLNRKHMAWFYESNCFVVSVVGHRWGLMESPADSVTLVSSDHGVTQRLYVIGNDISEVSVHVARLAVFNGLHQTGMGGFYQSS